MEAKFPSKKQQIKEGDFVKFGKQVLRVQKIQLNSNKQTTRKIGQSSKSQNQSVNNVNNTQSVINCRICLEQESSNRPFEKDLCACSRSMPAHVECLLSWIESKCIKRSENGSLTIDYASYFCDICKQAYPPKINLNEESINILDHQSKFESPFIVFDFFEAENKTIQTSLILSLKDKNNGFIKVGRQKENDIFLKDISVSRNHARFWWIDQQLFLFDQKSKFGTAIAIQDSHTLEPSVTSRFIIDKCLLTIELTDSSKFCGPRKTHEDFCVNPIYEISTFMYYLSQIQIESPKDLEVKIEDEMNLLANDPANSLEFGVERQLQVNQQTVNIEGENNPNSFNLGEISSVKNFKSLSTRKQLKNNVTINFGEGDIQSEFIFEDKSSFQAKLQLKNINRVLGFQQASIDCLLKENEFEENSKIASSLFELKKPRGVIGVESIDNFGESQFYLDQIQSDLCLGERSAQGFYRFN